MTGPELRRPLSALVSFYYYPRPADVAQLHDGGMRLVADSGAYSALSLGKTIDVEAFAQWARDVREHVAWVASLDAIGDAAGTWVNWQRLRELGVESVPTVHYGADPRELDRYAEHGVDFVGLGGMVGRKSEPARLMRWALAMMRYARDTHPAMRFHGWGVTHPLLVRNLPWYSIDSSGFGSGYRYGRLNLFDPDTGKLVGATLDGRGAFKVGALLRRHYSVEPAAVATSSGANIDLQLRVGARASQLLEDYLRRRYAVEPPTYGLREPVVGTAVHFVDAALHNMRRLIDQPTGATT